MPYISEFFGIIIRMYWIEHGIPHFHAEYNQFEAVISIESLEIIAGELPNRVYALILEWAAQHRKELQEDWELARAKQNLKRIEPLQ